MIKAIWVLNPAFAGSLFAALILIVWRLWHPRGGVPWLAAVFPPLWFAATVCVLTVQVRLTPTTLDRFLYAADSGFGFQPAFAGARLLLAHPWLLHTCEVCYFSLMVALTVMYLVLLARDAEKAHDFLRFAVCLGIAGLALYFACPAVGPGGIFPGDFPYRTPRAEVIPIAVGMVPRNCMPSLHTVWILCLLWSAPRLSRWRRAALFVFSGFTLLYALSAGAHYLVDLIVAVPFTRVVRSALDKQWGSPLLQHNAAVVVLWLILLRYGTTLLTASKFGLYALSACTVAGAIPAAWPGIPSLWEVVHRAMRQPVNAPSRG